MSIKTAVAVMAVLASSALGIASGSGAASAATSAPSAPSASVAASQPQVQNTVVADVTPRSAVEAAVPDTSKIPLSAQKCNTPYFGQVGTCIYVNGNSAYVNYIRVAFVVMPYESITGYMWVKTILPHGTQVNFRTKMMRCIDHGPFPFNCYLNVYYYFKRTFALDYINQRIPVVTICAFGYYANGRPVAHHACDSIYGPGTPTGH
jgi:hypothetical protein